ncbi:hypothetical protein B0H13DRAFT_2573839 [Mycena leptocephala]|nr:hypothetical protein B0H13DRAFT_2573839 [Mycena leptocephala]
MRAFGAARTWVAGTSPSSHSRAWGEPAPSVARAGRDRSGFPPRRAPFYTPVLVAAWGARPPEVSSLVREASKDLVHVAWPWPHILLPRLPASARAPRLAPSPLSTPARTADSHPLCTSLSRSRSRARIRRRMSKRKRSLATPRTRPAPFTRSASSPPSSSVARSSLVAHFAFYHQIHGGDDEHKMDPALLPRAQAQARLQVSPREWARERGEAEVVWEGTVYVFCLFPFCGPRGACANAGVSERIEGEEDGDEEDEEDEDEEEDALPTPVPMRGWGLEERLEVDVTPVPRYTHESTPHPHGGAREATPTPHSYGGIRAAKGREGREERAGEQVGGKRKR